MYDTQTWTCGHLYRKDSVIFLILVLVKMMKLLYRYTVKFVDELDRSLIPLEVLFLSNRKLWRRDTNREWCQEDKRYRTGGTVRCLHVKKLVLEERDDMSPSLPNLFIKSSLIHRVPSLTIRQTYES